MAFVRTPMTGWSRLNNSVSSADRFDSTFEKSVDSAQNCTLQINLRLFYRRINPPQVTAQMMRGIAGYMGVPIPGGATAGMYPDHDHNFHLVKDWSGSEWSTFTQAVRDQAKLWDGKFWLVPPDDFSVLDINQGSWTTKSGGVTFRPNIRCSFRFDLTMSPYYAHGSIDVVNLLGPGFFRSNSGLYNSSDTALRSNSYSDWALRTIPTKQPVIAHEIGHALGLPHIGVSRNLPQCGFAVVLGQNIHSNGIPAIYKGGTNADVCYGERSAAGDIKNIMGTGDQFSQENAAPWLNRVFEHFNLDVMEAARTAAGRGRWRVVTADIPPRKLAGG